MLWDVRAAVVHLYAGVNGDRLKPRRCDHDSVRAGRNIGLVRVLVVAGPGLELVNRLERYGLGPHDGSHCCIAHVSTSSFAGDRDEERWSIAEGTCTNAARQEG